MDEEAEWRAYLVSPKGELWSAPVERTPPCPLLAGTWHLGDSGQARRDVVLADMDAVDHSELAEYRTENRSLRESLNASLREGGVLRQRIRELQNDSGGDMYENEETTTDSLPQRSTLGSMLANGAKIAAGATVLSIVARSVSSMALKAGVPQMAIDHPVFQAVVKLASPTVMRLVAQRVPHVQDITAVDQVLEMAQLSAVTSVTQETIDSIFEGLAPVFEQIGAATGTVEQVTEGAEATA